MALKKNLHQVVPFCAGWERWQCFVFVRYCTCPGLLRKLGIVLHQVFLWSGPQLQLEHVAFHLYCNIWIKCPSGIFICVSVEGLTWYQIIECCLMAVFLKIKCISINYCCLPVFPFIYIYFKMSSTGMFNITVNIWLWRCTDGKKLILWVLVCSRII